MCSGGCSSSQNNVPSSGGVPQIILDVNRLSGSLPSAFDDMYGINVLDGNVFECADGYGSRGLPKHDQTSDTYICGADEFNRAMISVASISSLVGLICIAVLLLSGRFNHLLDQYPKVKKLLLHLRLEFSLLREFITTAAMFSRAANAPIQPVGDKYHNILEFVDSFTLLRELCIKVLLFSVLVCLPVYIMLYSVTDQFSTHRDKYSWISTSVFLTGDVPAAILSVLWLSCCLFVVTMIARRYCQESIDWSEVYQRLLSLFSIRDGSQYEDVHSEDTSIFDQPLPVSVVDRDEIDDAYTLNSALNNSSSYSKKSMASVAKDGALHYSYILLVFVLNVALAMVVNSVYVSIQSSDTVSSSSKILCQVGMAGVKLFINMVVVKSLIAHIPFCKSKARLHVAMVVFNSVVAPCLATALSDSSCFEELFVGSGTICSSYDFKACLEVDQELINGVYVTRCTHYSYPSFVIEFDPAFTYNYSCGSAILMSYIPVFIYTYLIVGFCTPIFYCLLAKLPADYFHDAVLRGVDAVLRPQDLTRSESGDNDKVVSAYIQGGSIQALHIQHITILLTFGLNSPLLAMTIVLSLLVTTFMWQCIIFRFIRSLSDSCSGRPQRSESCTIDVVLDKGSISDRCISMSSPLLVTSISFAIPNEDRRRVVDHNWLISSSPHRDRDSQFSNESIRSSTVESLHSALNAKNNYLEKLNASCGHTWYTAMHCKWFVLYCCLTFYSFILFDIVGDSHGLNYALIVPAAFFVICIVVRTFLADICNYFWGPVARTSFI